MARNYRSASVWWARIALASIGALAIITAAACAPSATQAPGVKAPETKVKEVKEKTKVRIAQSIAVMPLAAIYVAQQKGYFEGENLDVQIETFTGGGAEVQALISKNAEFGGGGGQELLKTYQVGNPVLGVMNMFDRLTLNVVVSKKVADANSITSKTPLQDKLKVLKGLNIGITRAGSLSDVVARYYLQKAGLVPGKDAKLVAVGATSASLAGLEQGKLDGFVIGPPTSDQAVVRGAGFVLVDIAQGEDPDLKEFLMEVLMVMPEYAKENPDTVKRVVRALTQASKWMRESSPEQVATVFKKVWAELDDEVTASSIRTLHSGYTTDGVFREKSISVIYDIMEKTGQAETRVPWGKLATNDFVTR